MGVGGDQGPDPGFTVAVVAFSFLPFFPSAGGEAAKDAPTDILDDQEGRLLSVLRGFVCVCVFVWGC